MTDMPSLKKNSNSSRKNHPRLRSLPSVVNANRIPATSALSTVHKLTHAPGHFNPSNKTGNSLTTIITASHHLEDVKPIVRVQPLQSQHAQPKTVHAQDIGRQGRFLATAPYRAYSSTQGTSGGSTSNIRLPGKLSTGSREEKSALGNTFNKKRSSVLGITDNYFRENRDIAVKPGWVCCGRLNNFTEKHGNFDARIKSTGESATCHRCHHATSPPDNECQQCFTVEVFSGAYKGMERYITDRLSDDLADTGWFHNLPTCRLWHQNMDSAKVCCNGNVDEVQVMYTIRVH
jgi:hypothetical protein